MGWLLDKRSRAERVELKKHQKVQKEARRVTTREREIGELKDRTRLLKAKKAYKESKRSRTKPLVSISIAKKKQGKPLSRKRRITIF